MYVCGGCGLWRIPITARGNRGRPKRIVMLCPCVCLFCTHTVCACICVGTQGCTFVSVHLYVCIHLGPCASVCVSLPLGTCASICLSTLHDFAHLYLGIRAGHKSMHSVEGICLNLNKLCKKHLSKKFEGR